MNIWKKAESWKFKVCLGQHPEQAGGTKVSVEWGEVRVELPFWRVLNATLKLDSFLANKIKVQKFYVGATSLNILGR